MNTILFLPFALADAVRNNADWALVCLNPENQGQFYRYDFELTYKGERVLLVSRLYGFGFGSQWVSTAVAKKHVLPLCELLRHNIHLDNLFGINGIEALREDWFVAKYSA